jgi:hypothetical protein
MAKRPTTGKRRRGSTGKAPNVERIVCDESLEASKGCAFDTPVDIYIIHYRTRLGDTRGVSEKAAIDGCVHRGILIDDSTKYIREIRDKQIKVKNQSEEKTLLIFTPVKD